MSHLPIEPGGPSRQRGGARSIDDHPSTERLAALADEQPTADERAHLDRCPACAREVETHRALLDLAVAERGTMGLPLTRWDSLAERLRAEGLLAGAPAGRTGTRPRHGRWPSSRSLLQAAAAIILIASGAIMGRASTGASLLPGLTDEPPQTAGRRPFAEEGGGMPVTFASVEEAEQWKDRYANAYQSAVSYLAEHDSSSLAPESPAVIRARLSALDQVYRTTRQALNDAPFDPVLNDFYINSFGQREATLRQLNAALPQGVRMNGF